MSVLCSHTLSSLLTSASLYRCPYFLFATTSSCKKGPRKTPFVNKREALAVQTISRREPSRTVIPSATHRDNIMLPQRFDHFLVLDFEATCTDDGPILPYPEIIELPVAKLDAKTWTVSSYFHQYVRPTANPIITSFCTHLTGIIQEMVDNQPTIDEVLQRFHLWMKHEGMLSSRTAFITCGDWDLGIMLPSEAKNKRFEVPQYLRQWINVKKSYCDHTGTFAKGLRDLLNAYGLQHAGRLHSGIDDVKTICAITSAIGKEGYVYRSVAQHVD
ncbi:unnamed protein product [Cylicocyclus nassatus]|uniref:Exonuclease domain-containing protein n=1 Tax=Cylicocyclus nassatus TaxID=53992 RepID=A0AA36DKB8_CYLNA|nr:unnamed protein product [Cylicocyclus nassatus]